jgi:hypothetical protein
MINGARSRSGSLAIISLDRLERDRRPPFTRVLVAGDAHPAALLQEPPNPGGEIRG